jgi:hypothetical protein
MTVSQRKLISTITGTFFTIFLCYVIGSLPLVYIISYRKSGGFTSFLMYGMSIGLIPTIMINDDYYVKLANVLKHSLLVITVITSVWTESYLHQVFSKIR